MMQPQRVRDLAQLRRALATAKPGAQILLEPGEYTGDVSARGLHGAPERPILIAAADPSKPPRLIGRNTALQLSQVSYLEIRDLVVEKGQQNGINIDDGGTYTQPSHHLLLKNIRVSDIAPGNHDGIKLSGIDDFRVESCTVARWGGSAIDMVGCHRGVIVGCRFQAGGDNGVQCKGGSSSITVQRCRFESAGSRGVNVGGSTGMAFFRPPIDQLPAQARYEAKDITVEGCTFTGSDACLAFVGVDGAMVRFNTLYHPKRWAFRILQETQNPGFVPCRNGVIEDNLIVFLSDAWSEGGVNIGPGTAPTRFRFARNFWYCSDQPGRSRPTLPTAEVESAIGRNPQLRADLTVDPMSPARAVGAHAFRLPSPR